MQGMLGWSIERLSKGVSFTLAIFQTVLVSVLNYLTGPEVAFSIFYLIPVSFSAWFIGHGTSLLISLLSTILWYIGNIWLQPTTDNVPPLTELWNAGNRLGIFIIVAFLVSNLRKRLEQKKALARTDPLTGIGNTRAFFDTACFELQRARRYGSILTIAYLDLDNFKEVNDQLGHLTGDSVLETVAKVLVKETRASDFAARVGGDELRFCFLRRVLKQPRAPSTASSSK